MGSRSLHPYLSGSEYYMTCRNMAVVHTCPRICVSICVHIRPHSPPFLLHPTSDVGLAVNIMRPSAPKTTTVGVAAGAAATVIKGAGTGSGATALGFHFDSIDSSARAFRCNGASSDPSPSPSHSHSSYQSRGATGVIGIQVHPTSKKERHRKTDRNSTRCDHQNHNCNPYHKPDRTYHPPSRAPTSTSVICSAPPRQDCLVGGERVVFPSIDRSRVDAVRAVVSGFDPLAPHAPIGAARDTPVVFLEPTAGSLYLFDGGDVLHGVSQVRQGARIAMVFLFDTDRPPDENSSVAESAKYFYSTVPAPLAADAHLAPPAAAAAAAAPEEKAQKEVYEHGRYDSVYKQSTPEVYDQWALDPTQGYDATVAAQSIAVRSVCAVAAAAVAAMPSRPNGPGMSDKPPPVAGPGPCVVLDAGCGTGRIAEVTHRLHTACTPNPGPHTSDQR